MRTKRQSSVSRGGITLLEVLAAIFVVSIGLLGVLAVIPFGAFQVSKAHHAGYASNMLANAAEEIFIREMAKPQAWGILGEEVKGGTLLKTAPPPEDMALDCTKFIWVEPREMTDVPVEHIFFIGPTFESPDKWQEMMRGQDDLVYTSYDDKRPDFAGQNKKIQSSGKYTWFFTFLPEVPNSFTEDLSEVPLGMVNTSTDIDVLACYNRVPTDDEQVECNVSSSFGGGRLESANIEAKHLELLAQTKYVFVTWEPEPSPQVVDEVWCVMHGVWCKVVFVDKSDPAKPKIVVTTVTDKTLPSTVQVYIPSGVLYHKRLKGVPIR